MTKENRIDIKKVSAQFDEIMCDLLLLDFKASYLGDEIEMYIDSHYNDDECWKITFLRCYKVNYETEAGWIWSKKVEGGFEDSYASKKPVRDITKASLLMYALQKLEVEAYEGWLYHCDILLSNMEIEIICQDILVEKVLISEQDFFWSKNFKL